MKRIELTTTRVAVDNGHRYVPGALLFTWTLPVAVALMTFAVLITFRSRRVSVERICRLHIKLGLRHKGQSYWLFFGPTGQDDASFTHRFVPRAVKWLRFIGSHRWCAPQAQIMAFPGVRTPVEAAA